MDIEREGGRGANQLRPMDCSRNVLNRAHGSGSCSNGETIVLAAVYGPKSGTKKNENPEKACLEVIWKPKIGQIGKTDKEFEMILKRTLQNICLLTAHPNTTTSIIIQVVHDDGSVSFFGRFLPYSISKHRTWTMNNPSAASDEFYCIFWLLPCAIHAACAALVDAGIPLKYLAVAICCCLVESGRIILDPNKIEEQRMKALVHLVFPSPVQSVLPEGSKDDGIITSLSHGAMTVDDYFQCVKHGRAAVAPLSNILKKKLQSQSPSDQSVTS